MDNGFKDKTDLKGVRRFIYVKLNTILNIAYQHFNLCFKKAKASLPIRRESVM